MDAPISDPRPAPGRPRGFAKRWLFRLAVLAALLAAAEFSSALVYRVIDGRPFSRSHVEREQRRLVPLAGFDGPSPLFHADIHPYLGFSYQPDWRGAMLPGEAPISEWGFTDKSNRSPARKRGPNKVVVAILGGSVASVFAGAGVEALGRELQQSPRYSGKEIEFVSLAVGGFRQPQQVLALDYALAMGGEFDVVLNIDGLNEIAWYRQDNGVNGVYYLYPQGWHHIVSKMPDQAHRREVGKIAYLLEGRSKWAALCHRRPLRWSVTAGLLWKLRDRQMAAEITNTEVALRGRRRDDLPYRARGPHNNFRNDKELMAEQVASWERCSLLLEKTCRAHGIAYHHVLQPNQYVPGSKPMGAEEKKVALWDELPGKPLIEEGYPLLREGGRRLAKRGVRFHDLSMAFAKHKETFYFDNCCHFNRAGNEVLARAVARAILETREPPRAAEKSTSLKPPAP
ncbi:MAG TPA: hypothetical protein VFE78_16175 [Gemmataceae bacterium]|nr:hypothetical protein [Gemmataceae bacterium]